MAEERIQKILARLGVASRRAAEQLMLDGKVIVNGKVADKLGQLADPDRDHIRVGGKLVTRPGQAEAPRHYYLAFKPREMITSLADPEGRATVKDLLKKYGIKTRVYPVGRLDWDADGLLILTDDGDLANRVMHPRTHLPKVYSVKIKGIPDERQLDRVRRGVMIERGVRTLPAEVVVEQVGDENAWLRVILQEGRQNQIKRMFELVGHPVRRIRRLAIGPLKLGRMRVGEVRPMTLEELDKLRRALERAEQGEPVGVPATPKPAAKRSILARVRASAEGSRAPNPRKSDSRAGKAKPAARPSSGRRGPSRRPQA